MILVILLIIVGYFILQNFQKPYTISCDASSDISCKMYSIRDIQSKCSAMCVKLSPNYVYDGKHTVKDDIHECECTPSKTEHFELDFTKINEDTHILPNDIPNDESFSNRNVLDKHKEDRLHKLIFG